MKKHIIIILATALMSAISCNYLDISPELGLTEENVYTNLSNFQAYLASAYDTGTNRASVNAAPEQNLFYGTIPMGMDHTVARFPFSTMTDLADCGRNRDCLVMKGGSLASMTTMLCSTQIPIFKSNWKCIRIANNCIANIDKLQDCDPVEKTDLLAQAYFIRGWCHMHLCIYYGGQPYLDHALQADESWDLERESSLKTFTKAAADLKKAYDLFESCGRVRRDPVSGDGHLAHSQQAVPGGAAAIAAWARCLLYAASPLSNTTNDKKLWENAAAACSMALSVALKNGYALETFANWEHNWKFERYTNEQIWGIYLATAKAHNMYPVNFLAFAISNATHGGGEMPTQQCVDLYETKWGDPLFTEEERAEAIRLGHYVDQNPYINRDPRFYKTVIFDGATAAGVDGVINIYYDPDKKTWPATILDGETRYFGVDWNSSDSPNSSTGYYSCHNWDGHYLGSTWSLTDPVIRLAELYLNYAEAVNMAYGPDESLDGNITAVEAVNLIRNRAGMPDVQSRYTADAESFNKRIQNERTIEFMFEGHHYFEDERRWKIAPERMKGPLYGMYIESCPVDDEHPVGKIFTRTELAASHQSTWKEPMYYFYLPPAEANKYSIYKDNENW